MSRKRIAIALVAMVLGSVLLYRSCAGEDEPLTEEDRIRRAFDEVARLADDKDLSGLLEYIAEDYRDEQRASKQDVRRMLAAYFLRSRSVGVYFRDLRVTVHSEAEAEVRLRAVLTRGQGMVGEVIPTNATVYDFWIELARIDDAWRITSHRRQRVRGGAF